VLALVAGSGVAVGLVYPVALPLARAFGGRPALESWLNLAGALLAHVLVLRVVERRPLADVGLGRDAARPARLLPVVDANGQLTDLQVDTTQGFIAQHLERSVLGKLEPAEATRAAVLLATNKPEAIKELFKQLKVKAPGKAAAPR